MAHSMMANPTIKASLLVALSGTLYGFLGYLGTIAMQDHLSIAVMLLFRFMIAGLWMFLFVIAKNEWQQVVKLIISTESAWIFLLGALGYAGSSASYFVASQYDGTGVAMVIFFSYPILIAFVSWIFYRKNLSIETLITLVCMSIGLVLLRNGEQHAINWFGILSGLIAAALYAFYILGSKKISNQEINSNTSAMFVCFGCAFACLLFSLFTHQFAYPKHFTSITALFALGILATAIPIQLMLEGLKYISSMRASIISVLEPLVTLLVGMMLLHEKVTHIQLMGASILLGSALLIQFKREL